MDALLKIPDVTNECEEFIHGFESLDGYPESDRNLLIPIMTRKLPAYEMRRIMMRSHDGTTWTLAELRY